MKSAVSPILMYCLLLFTAASCSKPAADSDTLPKTKTALLAQAAWKLQTVALDTNKDGVADGDATGYVQPCKLDNSYTFKTDGSGTMDEAAIKCNNTDPQTLPFTWLFKNNETVLSGNFSFTNGDVVIVSLSETSLVVSYDDNFGTATTYHIIATLKH
jgi:hypothetical protein